MKINKQAVSKLSAQRMDIPILPLVPERFKVTKENSISFKLRSDPTKANSTTYDVTMPVLRGGETVRVALEWYTTLNQVFIGMATQVVVREEANRKDQLAQQVLREQALTAYERARESSRDSYQPQPSGPH